MAAARPVAAVRRAGTAAPAAARPDRPRFRGVRVAMLLVAAVVVAIQAFGIDDGSVALLYGLFSTVVLTGVAVSFRGGFNPVELTFWLFQYCWLVVPAGYQLTTGHPAWSDWDRYSDSVLVQRSIAVYTAGVATYLLVQVVRRRRTGREPDEVAVSGSADAPDDETRATWLARGFRRAAFVCTAGAFVLLPYAVVTAGGIGAFFSSRSERASAIDANLGSTGGPATFLAGQLPSALSVAGFVLAVCAWRVARAARVVVPTRLLVTLGTVALVLYCNPTSNTRVVSLTAIGAALLVVFWPTGKNIATVLSLGIVVALLVVYPLASVFRNDRVASTYEYSLSEQFSTYDFDGFQQIVNSVEYADQGYQARGEHVASALLVFVPRSVWPGKAEPASIEVAQHRGYWFADLSLPMPIELYIDVSLVGMLVGMAAMGAVSCVLDDAYRRRGYGPAAVLAPVLAVAQVGLLRGPLGSQAPFFLSIVLALGVGAAMARRTPRGERRAAPRRDPGRAPLRPVGPARPAGPVRG